MVSLNHSVLTGRLTRDPEIRYTAKDEKPVAHFAIAVDRIGKNKDVDFINCVAWGGLAQICGRYLKKGRLVAIEGRIQVNKYEAKNGEKKTSFEIIASNMQMLDHKFHKAAEEAK